MLIQIGIILVLVIQIAMVVNLHSYKNSLDDNHLLLSQLLKLALLEHPETLSGLEEPEPEVHELWRNLHPIHHKHHNQDNQA